MTFRHQIVTQAKARIGDSSVAARLENSLEGEVLFDSFSRGRYSTDASHYQIEPIGVIVPKSVEDIEAAMEIAREEDIPILPRGGGTSQSGQTIGEALVLDVSKHLNKVVEFDPASESILVEPGIALDQLNGLLNPHGLMFMVDVSTSSRATIGGMTGNNSCGSRSIRYGIMRDNVIAIDAILANGEKHHFGELPVDIEKANLPDSYLQLARQLLEFGNREADEILARFPRLMRRVGGYNIDSLVPGVSNRPGGGGVNLAHLLVGSEGTLGFSTQIKLKLHRQPSRKVLGICHFPSFHKAMDTTRHIVKLNPTSVELVDRTMMDLALDIPIFRPTIEKFVRGRPGSLLLVEFAGEDESKQLEHLKELDVLMSDLGFPNSVVDVITAKHQKEILEVRKSGLNIMMSMKGAGKPISFIEDCAVPLEDLAEYTSRLTEVFEKNGTHGTWYAHASVGCLHVRPVINLKEEDGARKMRAIAEEAFSMVREYKGSHSGEHGDGLVRSEFHNKMFGKRIVKDFEYIKDIFDPKQFLNPGKIVRSPKMDDRSLFRFKPDYKQKPIDTVLDWSEWGSFASATEMCNNNGACRKKDANVMCPSFRATGDEKHLTRGRANTLRLALSGQLGKDALVSDEMAETMALCISCKGCKRECPTGVDMARMKIEFLHHYKNRHGFTFRDRLIAYLPAYAPYAAKMPWLFNSRNWIPGAALLAEAATGISSRRKLPRWRTDWFRVSKNTVGPSNGTRVVLLADIFNSYFEPEILQSAVKVLTGAGYRVHILGKDNGHPLDDGRTLLATGMIKKAKKRIQEMINKLKPFAEDGVPIIGLEPSSIFMLRDEYIALLPGPDTELISENAMLFEEFLAKESDAGNLKLRLQPLTHSKALLHGHCHQKAFATMSSVQKVLGLIPNLQITTVSGSCCGMAGSFGYQKETYDLSIKMGEMSILPAVREAEDNTLIIADGTSCRHQIVDGAQKKAQHVARVLDQAMMQ